jgi:nucleoside-diphosphate-sugar epimerase
MNNFFVTGDTGFVGQRLVRAMVAWTVFKGLPEPPEELKLALNYKD